MLWNYLSWKVLKLSLYISVSLSVAFLLFQVLRIDKLLFSLSLWETLPFIALWLFYFVYYFLPTGIFIASSVVFYELTREKKLQVVMSFGLSPKSVLFNTFLRLIPLFLSLIFSSFLIHQEDISFLRRYLSYKYYLQILNSVPTKTFFSLGDITLYVEEKNEGAFREVFFKRGDNVVLSRSAEFKEDSLIFRQGSVLLKENNKYYLTSFSQYSLNLKNLTDIERREKDIKKDTKINLINTSLSPILLLLGFFISQMVKDSVHRLYYTVGIISILYQLALVIIRASL